MDEEIKSEEIIEEKDEAIKEPATDATETIEDAVEDVVDEVMSFVEIADMISKLDEKLSGYFDRIAELLLKTGSVVETDSSRDYITEEDVEYIPVEELDLSID